jgi:4-aminobutyrate--pyruvate transaminase
MQIKLTWYYNNARGRPQKKKVISRIKGYHGVTIASGSLTGLPAVQTDFDLPIKNILHTSCPHYYRFGKDGESEEEFSTRMAKDLEEMIQREGPDTVAAFIAEPIMGAGGVIIPPRSYFPKINEVLSKYDVRYISDEVICGFGRTGEWFGSDTLAMPRNAMSLAKQLTAGYAPLSAVAMDLRTAEAVEMNSGRIGTFGHGFTYGGHPVACAVGVKALEIYQRRNIRAHVQRLVPGFQKHLKALEAHPLVGEARGLGLMGAIELSPDKSPKGFAEPGKVGPRLAAELLKHGVILRAIGDTVAFCPPMIISEAEIEELFAPLPAALDATLDWARREGHVPA